MAIVGCSGRFHGCVSIRVWRSGFLQNGLGVAVGRRAVGVWRANAGLRRGAVLQNARDSQSGRG